ncbi:MAG: alpha-L-arabinofuranosidase [Phycisphaerales bacterium]|nr:alpha-L-arabinofuranosidase [Phycisphaerales bacterium]MCB9862305.1 alpha-L-arabinofuranosidase [Phycisphaerales bacterium]
MMRYAVGLVCMCVMISAETPPARAMGDDDAKPTGTIDVTVSFNKSQPAFEGWGTSLCWWAHGVGDWPDDKLDELIDWIGNPETGLGYTIFRYNIGGGDDPTHHHMRRHADIPGFRAGPDVPYDWNADAKQRRVLEKLVARVDKPIVEAFSNSPPYWMTISGCASGNVGGVSNLRPEMFDAFADYLADVVKHYRDERGITFRSVEPLNEPNAGWWTSGHNQEGCHFSTAEQGRIILALRRALDARGLREVQISASDANSIDGCLANMEAYDSRTIEALGQINTHSYWGIRRAALRKFAARHGKRLWQSESGPMQCRGDQMDAALFMAECIVNDLNGMQPAAWLEWQVVSEGNWGCIHIDEETRELRKSPSFFAFSAFTRAVRPGDVLLDVAPAEVVAAYSSARKEIVVVAVNATKKRRAYRCRFKGLEAHAERATMVNAFEGGGSEAIEFRGDAVVVDVAPKSVVTLRVAGASFVEPTKASSSKQ